MSNTTSTTQESPVKKFRNGLISVAVWATENNGKTYHNITSQVQYKDGDDFKTKKSLSPSEALEVAQLYQQAYAWVSTQ